MDLKELEKLFKLCRKQGVTDLVFKDVTVKFGDLPNEKKDASDDSSDLIPTDGLSDEELAFYHLTGGEK